MNAKEYLQQLSYYQDVQRNRQDILNELKASSVAIGLPEGEKIKKSRKNDKMSEHLHKIECAREDLQKALSDAVNMQLEIIGVIEQIPNKGERDVLRARYVYNMSYQEVSRHTGYSEDHAKTLHRKGLQAVEKILRKNKT